MKYYLATWPYSHLFLVYIHTPSIRILVVGCDVRAVNFNNLLVQRWLFSWFRYSFSIATKPTNKDKKKAGKSNNKDKTANRDNNSIALY